MLSSTLNNVIAVDLSTTSTGITYFINGEIKQSLINGISWEKLKNSSFQQILTPFSEYEKGIFWEFSNRDITPMLVIELSNFSNPLLTQRFSILAGIIISSFVSYFGFNTTIKLINANEWFNHFYNDKCIDYIKCNDIAFTSLKREQRKKLSIDKFKQTLQPNQLFSFNQWDIGTQSDLADSYWIAYYSDKVIDTFDKSKAIKKAKDTEQKLRTQRLKQEIKELRKEIKEYGKKRKQKDK